MLIAVGGKVTIPKKNAFIVLPHGFCRNFYFFFTKVIGLLPKF